MFANTSWGLTPFVLKQEVLRLLQTTLTFPLLLCYSSGTTPPALSHIVLVPKNLLLHFSMAQQDILLRDDISCGDTPHLSLQHAESCKLTSRVANDERTDEAESDGRDETERRP